MPAQSAASAVEDDMDDGAEDTGAYYTAKLTFFQNFPIKVRGAYYTNKCKKTAVYTNLNGDM